MRLTEQDLRYIIMETHRRYLDESMEEGKLGRALGAAALGGALMFGTPSCSKMDNPSEPPTEQVTPQRQQEIGTCLMTYDFDINALLLARARMQGFNSYEEYVEYGCGGFNPTYQYIIIKEFDDNNNIINFKKYENLKRGQRLNLRFMPITKNVCFSVCFIENNEQENSVTMNALCSDYIPVEECTNFKIDVNTMKYYADENGNSMGYISDYIYWNNNRQ